MTVKERRWRPFHGGPGLRGTPSRKQQAVETVCKRKFGNLAMWTYTEFVRKDGRDVCYVCERPATHHTWMNIWGGVYVLRTCACHYLQWDGVACDDLPCSIEGALP